VVFMPDLSPAQRLFGHQTKRTRAYLASVPVQSSRSALSPNPTGLQCCHHVDLATPKLLAVGGQVLGDMPATRYRLQRIVTAREADVCDRQPPASVAGLEAYGEDTAAQLLYLQARLQHLHERGHCCTADTPAGAPAALI